MRLSFVSTEWIRGGSSSYDSDDLPEETKYVPFADPRGSRPDRPPAFPIPQPDLVLDVGCGANKEKGAVGLDFKRTKDVDIQCDIFRGLPIRTSTADLVWAHEFLEHVPHRIPGHTDDGLFVVLSEIHRVLKKGGLMRMDVPHAYSHGAVFDPTHTRAFLPQTFNYLEPEGLLSYYSEAKWRVLALRITWAVSGGKVNDYHLSKRIKSKPVLNATRALMGATPNYIHAILQALK